MKVCQECWSALQLCVNGPKVAGRGHHTNSEARSAASGQQEICLECFSSKLLGPIGASMSASPAAGLSGTTSIRRSPPRTAIRFYPSSACSWETCLKKRLGCKMDKITFEFVDVLIAKQVLRADRIEED